MDEKLWIYIASGVVVFILLLVVIIRAKKSKAPDASLSHTERMFASVLEKAVGGQYQVHCKVPMHEVLEALPEKSDRAKRKALKKIRHRQFDYIVSDPANNRVVCAVELDDHAYDKKQFKKQDLFLEEICHDVNLPLLRVAPQNGYNLVEIIERFERTIAPVDYAKNQQGRLNLRMVDALNTL
ncbi:DUF2726 domain-containing protein [Neptuniibacter sp. QD48_11]|uniref:DUF2726 domain-containing protein n=1 Tax=unclassified Neptuniibacter TaxID=2630693 RepID=UPI0039F4B12C